jgi:homogentisate 1,2-dioxygenase
MNNNNYQSGFGNEFSSEAIPGSLPIGRNSPQRVAHGLYAEQISGTAFTAPRNTNRRSWLYRIRPAALHGAFERFVQSRFHNDFSAPVPPDQLLWMPPPLPDTQTDFVEGLFTLAGNGTPESGQGIAINWYTGNSDMQGRFFYNADAEMLFVPQQGRLRIDTELGSLDVEPQEIAVIPRGIRFRVAFPDGRGRGYAVENFGALLRIPDLGPIGSNGLANPRDFLTPNAAFEDIEGNFELIGKFQGLLWRAAIDHSPLDVVAWHGNYVPYKYDLRRFNTIGSISYDHPDPSISLVLTSPTEWPGVGNLDFVVFPPQRVLAMEDTFRPPYFHRNISSEFMGLIAGTYDARADTFLPGGCSLYNCMTGHGPDTATFERASNADLSKPDLGGRSTAFMIEARGVIRPTAQALACEQRQADFQKCWDGLPKSFVGTPAPALERVA